MRAKSSPGVRIPPSPPCFDRAAATRRPVRLRRAQVGSAGSRARERREPGQAGNGAAISVRLLVPGVPGGLHLVASRARSFWRATRASGGHRLTGRPAHRSHASPFAWCTGEKAEPMRSPARVSRARGKVAERGGFEPPCGFRRNWFSKPAHSAALAPLREDRRSGETRRRMERGCCRARDRNATGKSRPSTYPERGSLSDARGRRRAASPHCGPPPSPPPPRSDG